MESENREHDAILGRLETLGAWFVGCAAVALVVWVGVVVYAPHQRLRQDDQELAALGKARIAVAGVLEKRLVQESNTKSDAELDAALTDILEPQLKNGDIVIDWRTPPGERVTFPASAALRIEPRGGNNLVIYLRKTDFETVPYPDRAEFVTAVGKAWCNNTGEDSHWLLPSVYISDIRTGNELATYDCVHWSDLLQ